MKHAILTLSLLLTFAGPVMAAQGSVSEDPNDIASATGRAYQAQKKKLGACAATAQGNALDHQMIHADAAVYNENPLARVLRSGNAIY